MTGQHTASLPESPKATYQSPGRTPESHGKRHSTSSTISRESNLPVFVYETRSARTSPEGRRTSSPYRSDASSEETLHYKMSALMPKQRSTWSLIAYLAITVPSLALLSFLWTLVAIIPWGIASVCHATSISTSILDGYRKIFSVHANIMEVEAPENMKLCITQSLLTLPVSILVSIGGIFALCSQLYSMLLSEKDSDSSSLDRAMSFWFSWLCFFCKDMVPTKADDLV